METMGNVRKITLELPTYPSHRAPHIHSMELLTYTLSILHEHMGRHTIWGDSSHAQILYVWRFNCIRDPQGGSNLAFYLSVQYYISLGWTQHCHVFPQSRKQPTGSHIWWQHLLVCTRKLTASFEAAFSSVQKTVKTDHKAQLNGCSQLNVLLPMLLLILL